MGGLIYQPEVLKLFNRFTHVEDFSQSVEVATESNPDVTGFRAGFCCILKMLVHSPCPHDFQIT